MLQKLVDSYKVWQELFSNFSAPTRATIGKKIDELFINALELTNLAVFLSKEKKLPVLAKISLDIDSLKLFTRVMWECKLLHDKQYARLATPLVDTGNMIGKWIQSLK